MKKTFIFAAALGLTGLVAGSAFAQPASAAGGIETAVLVLDASGSMQDQISGVEKMTAARQAVDKLLDGWGDVPLGLTTYGNGGGCDSIQEVLPVGPVTKSAFMSKVNGLQATGATPLTEAVIKAAESLDYEHNQATVILVSDGGESCGGDPCEMARELEKMGVDLTVHVVGFGITADEAGLECIAKETGGQYKTASSAAELTSVLQAVTKDVEARKTKWRAKLGDKWGKNGRWVKGKWLKGRGDGHKSFWTARRNAWWARPQKRQDCSCPCKGPARPAKRSK